MAARKPKAKAKAKAPARRPVKKAVAKKSAAKKPVKARKALAAKSKPRPKPKPRPAKTTAAKPAVRVVTKVVTKEVVREVVKEVPAPQPKNAIGLVSHHSDYATRDVAALKAFWVDTLGFGDAQLDPAFGYLFVNTTSGSSLGFMPPMGEGALSEKEPTIYLIVEDVDRAFAGLRAKGVVFEMEPADQPWGHRVALLSDPDGRKVMIATPKKG